MGFNNSYSNIPLKTGPTAQLSDYNSDFSKALLQRYPQLAGPLANKSQATIDAIRQEYPEDVYSKDLSVKYSPMSENTGGETLGSSITLNSNMIQDPVNGPGAAAHELAHAADRNNYWSQLSRKYQDSVNQKILADSAAGKGSFGEGHMGYGLPGTLGKQADLVKELQIRHALEWRQPVSEDDLSMMPWLRSVKPISPYAPVPPHSQPNSWSYFKNKDIFK